MLVKVVADILVEETAILVIVNSLHNKETIMHVLLYKLGGPTYR